MARKKQTEKRTLRGSIVSISEIRKTPGDEEVLNIELTYELDGEAHWAQVTCYGEAIPKVFGVTKDLELNEFVKSHPPLKVDDLVEVRGNYRLKPFKNARKKSMKNRKKPTVTIYYARQIKGLGQPKHGWREALDKEDKAKTKIA